MSDLLSQAEINALLGDGSNAGASPEASPSETSLAEAGSAEAGPAEAGLSETGLVEADLAKAGPAGEGGPASGAPSDEEFFGPEMRPLLDDTAMEEILSNEQKDILGEIGNISMGTAATTLFALLNQKVLITTPRVKVMTWQSLSDSYSRPCVGVRVDYKEGLEGANILVLKQKDVRIICSLMMGGDGAVSDEEPLTELDLSAIGEAMNQMVGSSSTSISSMIKRKIDIDTPHAFVLDFSDDTFFDTIGFASDDIIVCVSFKMEIEGLLDSNIMQILPVDFALDMVDMMKIRVSAGPGAGRTVAIAAPPVSEPAGIPVGIPAARQEYAPPEARPVSPQPSAQHVNVQSARFQNFDAGAAPRQKENIDIIMDVPLEVSVELGRTRKKIREILEFSPGAIIELDKLAGEPIDILVNGKFVAKGEVVVIDENFGVRITDIISADKRL
ncbi:MAG: flagellar motor switch phosphatase FliY [Clostridiales bacterium]|jgi:flagellar motor switch protein FliN/FliY|nr:flagellar motor switch phosphatase FliY [Clostridiales bacterium]